MQQRRPAEALVHLDEAVAETEGTNLFGHALALMDRSEAEGFLGRSRLSRDTRAAADEILVALGVVAIPVVPLPR